MNSFPPKPKFYFVKDGEKTVVTGRGEPPRVGDELHIFFHLDRVELYRVTKIVRTLNVMPDSEDAEEMAVYVDVEFIASEKTKQR